MNVVHYVAAFSPLSQTFIYDLVTGLEARAIVKNTVITRRRELPLERPFDRAFVCKNKNPFKKLYASLTDPSHLKIHNKKAILERFKESKVNIVHSHFAISALRMNELLTASNLEIPHICSFHGNDVLTNPHKIKGYKEALLKLNAYPKVLMTVPSQFLKDVCTDLGLDGSKIRVVHNTIHPRFMKSKQPRSWDGKEKLKIITIGRLVEMKGHEYAIKGLAILKKTFPNFEYIIGGSGFLENDLKKLTNELGLEDNIKFLGNLSHDQVPNLLSESHICLIPGIRAHDGEEDTFCLSLIEGAAVGLFCLTSDTRGPIEVLGPNTEFIFKQKDPQALCDAILNSIKDLESMSKKAKLLQDYSLQKFHPEQYFKNYQRIYQDIL